MKLYKNIEDMKEDNKGTMKTVVRDFQISSSKGYYIRKKKIIKTIILIVICVLIFKLFFGTIEIVIPFSYQKNRLYELELNNILRTVEVIEEKTTTIIPYFINIKSYSYELFCKDDCDHTSVFKQNEEIFLDIKAYKCYSMVKDVMQQIKCKSLQKNKDRIETNDIDYKLIISKSYNEIYNGDLVKNITPYLNEKGRYAINIKGKYTDVNLDINFWIEIE
jgi:hypothetical protein